MLRTIHLHGSLKKQFGPSFELDCTSIQEAAMALGYMVDGFQQAVVDGYFRVIAGDRDTGHEMSEAEIRMDVGRTKDIHIVPVPHGSKDSGIGKIIMGIALIGLSFVPGVNAAVAGAFASAAAPLGTTAVASAYTFGASLAFKTGAMLALGGVAMAMAGPPSTPVTQKANESFVFNGQTNNSKQGAVVPVVFGRFIVGSVVVSGGIAPENIPV